MYSLRGTWHLLVKEPRIGALCAAIFVLLLGFGVWAVWEGGRMARAQARAAVQFSLDQSAEGLKEDMNVAAFPNIAMQLYVLQTPKLDTLFGAAPNDGNNANFDEYLGPAIFKSVPYAAALLDVLLAPAGVVNSAYPMAGNEGAMGLNLLCDERCNATTGTTYPGCASAVLSLPSSSLFAALHASCPAHVFANAVCSPAAGHWPLACPQVREDELWHVLPLPAGRDTADHRPRTTADAGGALRPVAGRRRRHRPSPVRARASLPAGAAAANRCLLLAACRPPVAAAALPFAASSCARRSFKPPQLRILLSCRPQHFHQVLRRHHQGKRVRHGGERSAEVRVLAAGDGVPERRGRGRRGPAARAL
jgi:hypothetical protein